MEQLAKLKKQLESERPSGWSTLPDIDLYMDQVLSYMTRQHIGLGEGEQLTAAMVNNYIKNELLPRANGKKYSREHLAYLTSICLLKQVISVADVKILLENQLEKQGIETFYGKYLKSYADAFSHASEKISEELDDDKLADVILDLAVSSYAQKLACERLLRIAEQKRPPKPAKEKAKKENTKKENTKKENVN